MPVGSLAAPCGSRGRGGDEAGFRAAMGAPRTTDCGDACSRGGDTPTDREHPSCRRGNRAWEPREPARPRRSTRSLGGSMRRARWSPTGRKANASCALCFGVLRERSHSSNFYPRIARSSRRAVFVPRPRRRVRQTHHEAAALFLPFTDSLNKLEGGPPPGPRASRSSSASCATSSTTRGSKLAPWSPKSGRRRSAS
jgi:hypothetical protein